MSSKMVVDSLWRYPVKSMAGESVEQVQLDERGLAQDRELAVYTESNKIGSGKNSRRFERVEGLLDCRAEVRDGQIWVEEPGQGFRRSDDENLLSSLSQRAGQRLRLCAESEGSHMDDSPVHLLTSGTLGWLQSLTEVRASDRRLRPNVVIDTGDGPAHIEEEWVGRKLRIGDTELEVTHATERCVMIGLAQGDLEADPQLLKAVGQSNRACAGVYARVIRPGALAVGAIVQVLALLLLVACGSESGSEEDAGAIVADAAPADDFNSCTGACSTMSLQASFGNTSRGFDRAFFGFTSPAQSESGSWELYVENGAGADEACPTMKSPTPLFLLLVSGLSVPTEVAQETATMTLVDFEGALLTNAIRETATSNTVTWVAADPCQACTEGSESDRADRMLAIDIEASFPSGSISGHAYATHCNSLDSL